MTPAVKLWLQDTRHPHWLLIMDNLEDLESWNYKEYIPGGSIGSIILTSRRLDLEWTENSTDAVYLKLQEMHQDEVLDLLFSEPKISRICLQGRYMSCFADMLLMRFLFFLTDDGEEQAGRDICGSLGCLPLALSQAAAYMKFAKASMSRSRAFLANRVDRALRFRPPEVLWPYEKTVITTWEVSIPQLSSDAQRLLSLYFSLHHQHISLQLLHQVTETFCKTDGFSHEDTSMPHVDWLK